MNEISNQLLTQEQQRAVDKIVHSRGGLVWWKVGEGKTRISLYVFQSLQKIYNWQLPSICLVVCRRRAYYDWRSEIERCLPNWSVYEDEIPVHPPGLQRPVFLLISEGMLVKKVASLQKDSRIRFIVFDESWLYANHKSARAKAAYSLSQSRKAIALSGTVMKARDTFEIYAQCMIVHKHRYLATSPTAFRTKFQICRADFGYPTFSPKKGSYKEIMDKLSSVADVHFPSNANRKIHDQFHAIESTPQQRKYFRELKEFYSVEDHGLELNNALAVITKAQQIANGWLKTDTGKIVAVASNKPEKAKDELQDIIASGERAVVWCAFRYDVEMLADYLPFATVQMLGGQDFDLDSWLDPNMHVCLATEASGSSINHFEHTPYAIYYSSNFKWKDMQQSRGRTDRKSSKHTDCFYKYLQVVGSLDKQIYSTALGSGDREQMLILQANLKEWLSN